MVEKMDGQISRVSYLLRHEKKKTHKYAKDIKKAISLLKAGNVEIAIKALEVSLIENKKR